MCLVKAAKASPHAKFYSFSTELHPEVGSTGVQKYCGTFLVPLSVPSVLFQNSTVFGTVVTFLARLPRYSVLLLGMELKSFKRRKIAEKHVQTLPT